MTCVIEEKEGCKSEGVVVLNKIEGEYLKVKSELAMSDSPFFVHFS